ncbi:MAG: DUF5996 family protein [Chloroflexota bacterium]
MAHSEFPVMKFADWRPTHDTLHHYARVLGRVRRALTPYQRHWSHITLRVAADGLTTTDIPIPDGGGSTFEMLLHLREHRLVIQTGGQEWWDMPFRGQTAAELGDAALSALADLGVRVTMERSQWANDEPGVYDRAAVETYFQALSSIDEVFKQFKAELPGETGPVQIWPHGFDLAMLWFSGRQVPGADPADEEQADEQMNFGFSPGGYGGIPDAYFYVTAYPWPDGLLEAALPAGAYWHTAGWRGAVLPYEESVTAEKPAAELLGFLQVAHAAGARYMK